MSLREVRNMFYFILIMWFRVSNNTHYSSGAICCKAGCLCLAALITHKVPVEMLLEL